MTTTTTIDGAQPAARARAQRGANPPSDLELRFVLCVVVLIAAGFVGHYLLGARQAGLTATIALVGAVGLIASSVAHYALFRPIRQLVVVARAVRSGDFGRRLGFERRDDIGDLALEMDALSDQLEAAQLATEAHLAALDQLRHSDRVATLGRLASSVAHELGNPLSVIELRAQLITSGDADTLLKVRQNADIIVEQAHRMTRIIDEILSFARMHPARISRLDLGSVLRQAIALSEHTSKKLKTQIVLELPASPIEIDGDPDKLLQVVVNLVVNGVQAMPHGGLLDVIARDESRAPLEDPDGTPRDFVCIEFIDRGVGIAPQLLPRVFEPFVSTKSAEGGTGLGLSIAQGIVQEHSGWVSVESELGHGSTFKVYLPRRAPLHGSTSP